MAVICPSILASSKEQYHEQMEKIASFAARIQIDLTDGKFTSNRTVSPEDAWWPVGIKADFHLMYKSPQHAIKSILQHKPNLVIVHSEASGSFEAFAKQLHHSGVKIGVALLPQTSVNAIVPALGLIDHVLIFSGNLGHYGGRANLDLLSKVDFLKHHKSDIEIGWDGGINDQNISHIAAGGVDVFNVGGYIQNSPRPEHAYRALERIAEETGTT
jgi:ribulose-phosphate 3-epimerase